MIFTWLGLPGWVEPLCNLATFVTCFFAGRFYQDWVCRKRKEAEIRYVKWRTDAEKKSGGIISKWEEAGK